MIELTKSHDAENQKTEEELVMALESSEATETWTLGGLFEVVLVYEAAAYDLYLGLAEKFAAHPSISEFWKTMAAHEQSHIRALKQAYENLSPQDIESSVNPEIVEKVRSLPDLSVEDILMSIDNLEDAYQFVNEIENSAVSVRFIFLTQKLFDSKTHKRPIADSINQHLQSLMSFPQTFGNAAIRRKIPIDDPE